MPETDKPVFLVNAYADPVVVRIEGRACFQNSGCLRDFIGSMIQQGKARFVVDFQHCASMDSTFLGVLAGASLQLRKATEGKGQLVLARVGQRNLELIRNLGLHRLMTVDAGDFRLSFDKCEHALTPEQHDELTNARMVLEAHESLISADESNRTKFQDVLAFLKNRIEHK